MMRCLLSLPVIFAATFSNAQEGKIRTGEHEDFTRIVIEMGESSDWRVGGVEGGFGVVIEGLESYDPSDFFDRISRDRIADVRVDSDSKALLVRLACQCVADPFVFGGDKLVIDVKAGNLADSSDVLADLFPTVPTQPDLPLVTNIERPSPSLRLDFAQVAELEEVVVQGISRAASQGLLTPANKIGVGSDQVDMAFGDLLQNIEGTLAGLEAHTSLDVRGGDVPESTTSSGIECLSNAFFDVPSWGDDRKFGAQIAERRLGTTEEFDRPDPDAVLALARSYIFFGFGREAKGALEIDGVNSRSRQVISVLADIMDNETPTNRVLQNQLSCTGDAALWGFLAHPIGDYQQAPAKEAIMLAFKRLPAHLQVHLGPRLANRFAKIGEAALAEQAIYTATEEPVKSTQTSLAESQIKEGVLEIEEAERILSDAMSQNARITPDELLRYFELNKAVDEPASPEALALADVLRFEFRDTEAGTALALAEVSALLRGRDIPRALDVIATERDNFTADQSTKVGSEFFRHITELGSEAEFLDIAFGSLVEMVDDETDNLIAERLLSLGFPERAADLLRESAVGSVMEQRRYLRAEAQIEVGDAQSALAELVGISTQRAKTLRQQANLIIEGSNLSSGLDGSSNSVSRAWRGGDWGALATGEDVLLRNVSQEVLREESIGNPARQTLADGRSILERSAASAALLQEVLTRFEAVDQD